MFCLLFGLVHDDLRRGVISRGAGGGEFKNRVARSAREEPGGRGQMVGKGRVGIEPPKLAESEGQVGRAAAPKFLEVGNELRVIARISVEHALFLGEMP